MRRILQSSEEFSSYLARKEEFNVLYPSEQMVSISLMHKLRPEIIEIDPDPLKGEVYQLQSREGGLRDEYVIAKRGLEKIAWAAGIRFHPMYTRRTDDGRNPRRVEFQAVGSIQKPDGTWYSICRSKEINLDVIEEELRSQLEEAAQTSGVMIGNGASQQKLNFGTKECAREISLRLERSMIKHRKNMVAMADSGAYSRVVRSLLNVKLTYSSAQLRRPFVVPAVSFNMEYLLSRKGAREHLLKAGLASSFGLFGPAIGGDMDQPPGTSDRLRTETSKGETVVEQSEGSCSDERRNGDHVPQEDAA
jgi:hypothetical protein